jgi:hypothetical protein
MTQIRSVVATTGCSNRIQGALSASVNHASGVNFQMPSSRELRVLASDIARMQTAVSVFTIAKRTIHLPPPHRINQNEEAVRRTSLDD